MFLICSLLVLNHCMEWCAPWHKQCLVQDRELNGLDSGHYLDSRLSSNSGSNVILAWAWLEFLSNTNSHMQIPNFPRSHQLHAN
ncbi:hypothetical protein AQUCO_00200336v1 [Aquilegia coerulea]|uniref:Secreted protein n=1 Tax=Aquilegia coerulea TaxID=218851 RepID=A0A2G5F2N2_AQUCA|nr:hypothetical protein AQUCO_00200336v1 [Aquilegia coerulea]